MSKILRFSIIFLGFFSSWLIVANQGYAGFPGSVEREQDFFQQGNPIIAVLQTATDTATATATSTALPPTATDTPTATNTPLPSNTPTATNTSTPTATDTPTATPTATNTSLPSSTPTATSTSTPTATYTPTPTNSPPTISTISNRSINEDMSTGPISFQILDNETAASNLNVSASSSNSNLVSSNEITLSGTNEIRIINISPKENKSGSTTIVITVSDGQLQATESFELTVIPVNDSPTIDLNGTSGGTGYSTTFVSNQGKVVIVGANLLIQDVDNTHLSSARIEIANRKDGSSERLTVNTSGTNLSAQYHAGVLTINGNSTITNYQKVLSTASYQNTSDSPNSTIREITFQVNDGSSENSTSNIAISNVEIVNPKLSIEKSPDNQTIGSGGTAVFTLRVENVGNVNLRNVRVIDSLSPNCSRTIGNLRVGATEIYSCNKQEVMNEFINQATVEGRDNDGNRTTASDVARVDVDNPNIQIIKSPATQTLLEGQTASFEIFVVNTSSFVDLVDVTVDDPNSPNCNRIGSHQFSNLPAGETALYTCKKENVTLGFTNVITVTGVNLLTQNIVQDSSIAEIEMLDLDVELVADNSTIPATGGPVTFSITVKNSGTLDVTLTDLDNDIMGSLLDSDGNWLNNTCANDITIGIPAGGEYSCQLSAFITGTPPAHEFNIIAKGIDDEENIVTDEEVISISISDIAGLNVSLSASNSTVPFPGGTLIEYIDIKNTSFSEQISISSISHSRLGSMDGIGNCETSITIQPQDSFNCQFSIQIFGQVGDNETHTVQVNGETSTNNGISNEDSITINVVSPNIQNVLLPIISNLYAQPEEDNDHPCTAYPLEIGKTYSFLADDENDWFFIDVDSPGQIDIYLNEFEPKDGQLAVWSGNSCDNLTVNNAHNANFKSSKSVSFPANRERYFIWITNFDGISYENPYTLRIEKS